MDIFFCLCAVISVICSYLLADYYKRQAAKQEAYRALILERQEIAERIAIECYYRLLKQQNDNFVRRDEVLISLRDLLYVYGVGYKVTALWQRVVKPEPTEESDDES